MLQPLFQADDIWIGDKKGDDLYVETGVSEPEDYRLGKRYSSKIASSMDRVQANDNPSTPDYVTAITGLIVETREPHKQEHAEKMLTTGDYDAVKVEERRSSAASGVPPLPNVPSPASVPASLPLQGAPYVSSASLPADVPYNLPPPGLPSVQRRILDHSDTIGVNLESHQPDALAKRHEEKGVPGRVDVVVSVFCQLSIHAYSQYDRVQSTVLRPRASVLRPWSSIMPTQMVLLCKAPLSSWMLLGPTLLRCIWCLFLTLSRTLQARIPPLRQIPQARCPPLRLQVFPQPYTKLCCRFLSSTLLLPRWSHSAQPSTLRLPRLAR